MGRALDNVAHIVPVTDVVDHDLTGGRCVCPRTVHPIREDGTEGYPAVGYRVEHQRVARARTTAPLTPLP